MNAEQNKSPLLPALKDLFVNRDDCYCAQTAKGYVRIEAPLTDAILESHLKGTATIGSYQLDQNSHVKWVCFDLDPEKLKDPKEAAVKILSVCFEEKEEADGRKRPRIWKKAILLEASRFPDPSFHIWIFFSIAIPAKVAQWLGYRILEFAGLNPKEVEVFPKQTELTADRAFGNFVKLPLGKHQTADKWSRFLDLETFEPLPNEVLLEVRGITFCEADIAEIMRFKEKRGVQIKFELPKNFKLLSDREEEHVVQWLQKHWQRGYRNQLEMYFLGLCLKRGVSYESARRVIEEVALRTGDEEKQARLDLVDYHYKNRLNIPLKGKSGLKALVEVLKDEHKQNA